MTSQTKPVYPIPPLQTASGSAIPSTPSITSQLYPYLLPLFSADRGMVLEAKLSTTFHGKIIQLEKDYSFTSLDGSARHHYYLLKLENPDTGVAAVIDQMPNDILKTIKVWSTLNEQKGQIPLTIGDLKVGDMVETKDIVDLTTGKEIEKTIFLVER